ncbi:MAG: tRNA pseudouridine(38-40) synthase TruA [Atopobiaceae bacterium]|jgi:tRNA pseudouridine38-40 synthase
MCDLTRRGPIHERTVPEVLGAPATRTLVVKLGYRGADFSGFAAQEKERTVAGELGSALETLLKRDVPFDCAGRTDAGVSALAQYISVPLAAHEFTDRTAAKLAKSLVALTPDDIAIKELWWASADFSARFDALQRSYRYLIADGARRPVMLWDHAWWHRAPLDADAMDAAAQLLVGEHNFKSFCKASSCALMEAAGKSLNRCVDSVSVERQELAGEKYLAVDVAGNAFLHNMVRIMVGSLVEIGRGHRDAAWLAHALKAEDRAAAGPTAPAEGLTFMSCAYAPGLLTRAW